MRDFEKLLTDLRSSDSMVRFHAAAFLGVTDDPRTVSALVDALAEEKDERAWGEIAHVLGRMKAVESIEPLIRGLNGDSKSIRYSAAKALARIGDASIDSLISTIESGESFEVRAEALWALDEISYSRQVLLEPAQMRILTIAADDNDDAVRQMARALLERIGASESE